MEKGQTEQDQEENARQDVGDKKDAVGPAHELVGNHLKQIGYPNYPHPRIGNAQQEREGKKSLDHRQGHHSNKFQGRNKHQDDDGAHKAAAAKDPMYGQAGENGPSRIKQL